MISSAAALGLAAAAGVALGSFAVTAGLRMSRGESALSGRSRCDSCGRMLGFMQTVPLVSYARLGGACAGCGGRIDRIHLTGEVAGGLVVASSLLSGDTARSVMLCGLGLILIAAAAMDAKVRRLPNILTATVAGLGLALSALRSPAALVEGIVAAAAVVSVLMALRWVSGRLRGEPGLGLGDVKLIGALAIWLGAGTPWLVALSAVFGLAIVAATRPADGRLAFGPPIAVAAWIVGVGREAGAWPTVI